MPKINNDIHNLAKQSIHHANQSLILAELSIKIAELVREIHQSALELPRIYETKIIKKRRLINNE